MNNHSREKRLQERKERVEAQKKEQETIRKALWHQKRKTACKKEEVIRAKKRERARIRRAAIKLDEDLHRKLKAKERARWQQRKAQGKIKTVSEMTDREKRIARKRSRESSAKHYNRRKYLEESSLSTNQSIAQQSDTNIQATKSISSTAKKSDTNNQTSQLIDEITPVVDSANDFQILAPTRDNTLKKAAGAKKVAVHRSRTVRKLQRQQKLNTSLKRALWRTQKELQRAKKSKELTPRSKMKKFVRGKKISSEVRKKLVFGEVLQSEVKQSLGARSSKVKQAAYKIFSGSMIKHYKLQKQSGLSSYLLRRYGRNKCNKPLQYERAPKSHKIESVIIFLFVSISINL